MQLAPLPPDEATRLCALQCYDILDTAPEAAFDNLTRLAAQLCETPIALVSLIDAHRQWFKSKVGLEVTETPRDVAFCAHAILQPEMLIVPDTRTDVRFASNPLVTAEPGIRFYAGTPLMTPGGQALGTLCVIDRTPRTLTPQQRNILQVLGQQVVTQLELRRSLMESAVLMQEYQKAEVALRQSEVKFRTLVEQTNDWVWEIDLEGRFRYSNPKVVDILGYTPEDVLGKTTFDFMPAVEAQRLSELLNRVMAEQVPFTGVEKVLIHKNGQTVDIETSGAPIFDRVGKLQGYCGMARNITERKQTERKIQQALAREQELRALKSQFISMTSHEFGAPLSTITLAAELLEYYGHRWSEAERLERLHCIQTAAAQMRGLLADILLIGQAEAGKVQSQPVAVNLPEVCHAVVAQMQFQAGSQPTLAWSYNGPADAVYLDEKLLRQVLVNLLSNAMKYSPDGGVIQMQVGCDESQVRFEIQDDGIGIPPEDQPHLFDSFYRAQNVGRIAGTGLGLAIVKQCVEAMGGEITVESRIGSGTIFRFVLPLASNLAE